MDITILDVEEVRTSFIDKEVVVSCEVNSLVDAINEDNHADEIIEGLCENNDNVEIMLKTIGEDKVREYFNID